MSLIINTSSFSPSTFLFRPQSEWEGGRKNCCVQGKCCQFFWGEGCKRREGYLGYCLGYEKCQFDCPSWHVAVSMSRTLATQTSSPDTDKIMTFYTPCFTIEKKGETVSFSCLKFHAQNIPECRIGGLFKFKSDLFNKNEVKTLYDTNILC